MSKIKKKLDHCRKCIFNREFDDKRKTLFKMLYGSCEYWNTKRWRRLVNQHKKTLLINKHKIKHIMKKMKLVTKIDSNERTTLMNQKKNKQTKIGTHQWNDSLRHKTRKKCFLDILFISTRSASDEQWWSVSMLLLRLYFFSFSASRY